MSKLTVIGIAGHYGSGKDTFGEALARVLNKRIPNSARIFHFSDKLKEMAKKYFGWDGNTKGQGYLYSPETEQYIGGRKLLQGIGMAFRKEINENYWMASLGRRILDDTCSFAIITDVRFVNEARWIRDYEGHLVRIIRPDYHGDDNPSEIEMNTPDFRRLCTLTIENNSTREDLLDKAYLWAETLINVTG